MSRFAQLALGVLIPIGAWSTATYGPDREFDRSPGGSGKSGKPVRVIVRADDLASAGRVVTSLGGRTGRRFTGLQSFVAEVPETALPTLAQSAEIRGVSLDRPIRGALDRTSSTIGARWVAEHLDIDGTGIGVAIVDSGVTGSHDDLSAGRVAHFADFVDFQQRPHDGYGHGTHVAGIIAGSGVHSGGARRGIAPGTHLVVLKVLDSQGDGSISTAIAAIDYAIEHRDTYNIRVLNLSVAAGVYESYRTDPLTLAASRAVEAGIVVVTAAGNLGRNGRGQHQYGGITAPGNAPWVLTVGATTHRGTRHRSDDVVAPFSSLGPSPLDLVDKPDLVAPGVAIESVADAGSTLFVERPDARVWGTTATATAPYIGLSGTSMAAPVVAATVALMLQANPALQPDAVKAILRASAERHDGVSHLAQGAGFLNARAAVELARTFAVTPGSADLLANLVDAYGPEEGEWTAPCDEAEADCSYLAGLRPRDADCTLVRACSGMQAGTIVGLTTRGLAQNVHRSSHSVARPEATTIWNRNPARPVRQQPRKARAATVRRRVDESMRRSKGDNNAITSQNDR